VLPLAAVPQVMHHVGVFVSVNDGVMGVLHSDLLVTLLRIREPAGGEWPARVLPSAPRRPPPGVHRPRRELGGSRPPSFPAPRSHVRDVRCRDCPFVAALVTFETLDRSLGH
jgi:hypothetical protein